MEQKKSNEEKPIKLGSLLNNNISNFSIDEANEAAESGNAVTYESKEKLSN